MADKVRVAVDAMGGDNAPKDRNQFSLRKTLPIIRHDYNILFFLSIF